MSQKYQSPAALSPTKSPPVSLFGSSLHTSHTSFPIIAVAVIGILATAFLLVSYYIFVIKCCLNWHRIDLLRRFSFSRRRPVEDPLMAYSPAAENRGLNEAAIRSIPIFKFRKSDAENAAAAKSCECAVCLNEFQEEEKLRAIPNCGHVFHIDCIDIWLQNNANCPLCRTSISAARPDIRMPMDRVLGASPSPQDPSIINGDSFTGRDEDYVVIEIGSEQGPPNLPRIQEGASSNELLSNSPSLRKVWRKKAKKFSHVSSMGDECIDNRQKDERFVVQPIRRSFSMDSAADSQLYLAVQDIIQRHGQVNNEILNQSEDCSSSSSRVIKRSFFSFGQGRGSRSSVQPVALEPRG
ncbi:RING/U-box superfamily protein [Perilla frutescens var. hirtella]|nr:RING/U-box superfamily protein [Perilla frutescens var. hirtella]KAH6816307.1 RING/U-box superfamily protein [Perilla frutescens var. frutescens]